MSYVPNIGDYVTWQDVTLQGLDPLNPAFKDKQGVIVGFTSTTKEVQVCHPDVDWPTETTIWWVDWLSPYEGEVSKKLAAKKAALPAKPKASKLDVAVAKLERVMKKKAAKKPEFEPGDTVGFVTSSYTDNAFKKEGASGVIMTCDPKWITVHHPDLGWYDNKSVWRAKDLVLIKKGDGKFKIKMPPSKFSKGDVVKFCDDVNPSFAGQIGTIEAVPYETSDIFKGPEQYAVSHPDISWFNQTVTAWNEHQLTLVAPPVSNLYETYDAMLAAVTADGNEKLAKMGDKYELPRPGKTPIPKGGIETLADTIATMKTPVVNKKALAAALVAVLTANDESFDPYTFYERALKGAT